MFKFGFNLDNIFFFGFLAINLFVGLFYGRSIKNIKEYAIGNRNFSTSVLATTIIATYIGGDLFFLDLSQTYKDGLYYVLINLAEILSFFIVAFWLAPRMGEFLGMLSIAEAMGKLFGKKSQIITALCSIGINTGAVAMEFKVASIIVTYLFGVPNVYATIISGIVVIIYSAKGGIRSVTFTDLIQCFTFGTFIPILALLIWGTIENPSTVLDTLRTNPIFDYKAIFNYNNPRFWSLITLFMLFLLPWCFDPAMFQRVSMARNTKQVARSFLIAGLISIVICLLIDWIAILLLSTKANVAADDLILYIIEKFSYPGFKSFIVIGIMSTLMSTADSYINSSAVLFAHDICRPMKIKWLENNELLVSQLSTILIGMLAILIATLSNNLFELLVSINNFYVPIIVAPLLLAVLGFRSSELSVLIGMAAGVLSAFFWDIILTDPDVESAIPGLLMNLIFLVGSHYLLKQPGGLVGIKDPMPLNILKKERENKLKNILYSINNFNIFNFLKNDLPQKDSIFSFFGFFVVASTYSSLYTITDSLRGKYMSIYHYIYHSVLIFSTMFLTYPIWPQKLKKQKFTAFFWNFGVFYLLIFNAVLLVIISEFNQLQLMICLLNFVIAGLLLRWEKVLLFVSMGIFSAVKMFKVFINQDVLPGCVWDVQFQIIYLLLLLSSTFLVFIKPKQSEEKRIESSNLILYEKIKSQQKELIRSLESNINFFNNLDEGCIVKFKFINFAIKDLIGQLKDTRDPKKIDKITKKLLLTAERLNSGAGYLSEVMHNLQNVIPIKVDNVNVVNFINSVFEKYESLYSGCNFVIDFNTKHQQISCDQEWITYLFNNLIDRIINILKKLELDREITINISVEDQVLTYPISFLDEYIKKTDGIKFTMHVVLPEMEMDRKIDHIDPFVIKDHILSRSEKIITSHYGNCNFHEDTQKIVYFFNIPVKIDDIRIR